MHSTAVVERNVAAKDGQNFTVLGEVSTVNRFGFHGMEEGFDEGVVGDQRACVLTMVERRSGFAVIKKLTSRTAAQATQAAASALAQHAGKVSTITFDNGTEFHSYRQLERDFPVTCYFATPYHSWERGSNENLNGLLRQYLPRGTCLRSLTQKECDRIAFELNTRPRKRHAFKTPAEIYHGS